MIDTLYYAIGFIVYAGFCLFTFNVYSKNNPMAKILILIFIYAFYTLLAGYVISFVDEKEMFFVKFIEVFIYSVACAIFLYFNYKNVISNSEPEAGYGESPDNKLF